MPYVIVGDGKSRFRRLYWLQSVKGTRLSPLRRSASFAPGILIASGSVTVPTMVSVVMNGATKATVAPPRNSDLANGKATSLVMLSSERSRGY